MRPQNSSSAYIEPKLSSLPQKDINGLLLIAEIMLAQDMEITEVAEWVKIKL